MCRTVRYIQHYLFYRLAVLLCLDCAKHRGGIEQRIMDNNIVEKLIEELRIKFPMISEREVDFFRLGILNATIHLLAQDLLKHENH